MFGHLETVPCQLGMVIITIKLYSFFFNQIKATRVRKSRNFGKNYLAKFSILFDDISV